MALPTRLGSGMQTASPTIPPTVLEWSRGLASLSPGVPPCVEGFGGGADGSWNHPDPESWPSKPPQLRCTLATRNAPGETPGAPSGKAAS
ncbi:hypothetical protein DA075_27810 [Methylobacterium currus]|uniref:Uncharacterized protein n=1 Tax=Methylobacterium currus TaxID=2051553 RepID=A0A2R4WRR3_9HYPH|nr:hypothetical protein DA075_27810 [Methylobacterium currus]